MQLSKPSVVFIFFFFLHFSLSAQSPLLFDVGHVHNDYNKCKPLEAALEKGFGSVEADVFLRKGQLVVAHTGIGALRMRSLEDMYFKPLAEKVRKNNGSVFKNGPKGFILMIDVKSDAEETYDSLKVLFDKYRFMLTEFTPESTKKNAVTILISGRRNYEQILSDNPRFAAIDGRLADLNSDYNIHEVPRISAAYRSLFNWRGIRASMPESELTLLREIVVQADSIGVELRFWGATNRKKVWETLLDAGVHRINVDRIKRFKNFKLERNQN
ncbi:MAG: hypothetical protein EA412_04565 [Chitinophagaceae bacterium]|nr:MAG: hypothetical protein EA412_04565 [Chitinophagaceae bacterium]